jgi:hypothetical protein
VAGATGVSVVALVAWLIVRSLGPETGELPYSPSGLSDVCDGTVYPDAPAYTGAGPHPTMLFATDYNLRQTGRWSIPPEIVDAGNAALFSAAWRPQEPGEVQAVACMTVDEKSQNTIDRCEYRDPQRPGLAQPLIPVPMYRGEFTITLYETRTGRRIHRTTISGQDAGCPSTLPAGASRVYSEPSPQQYVDAIGRFVDG